MLTKWKTSKYEAAKIERVECSRETEKTVWVMATPFFGSISAKRKPVERRHMKMSDYDQYHDTWEAAHEYLMERAKYELDYARRKLQHAQDKFGNVKGMRKPPEAEC